MLSALRSAFSPHHPVSSKAVKLSKSNVKNVTFDLPSFTDVYTSKLDDALASKGLKKPEAPTVSRQTERQALLSAYQTAASMLSPLEGIALAAATSKELITPEQESVLQESRLGEYQQTRVGTTQGGIAMYSSPNLVAQRSALGIAHETAIIVDEALLQPGIEPVTDAIIGHEEFHIKSRDNIGQFGVNLMLAVLGGSDSHRSLLQEAVTADVEFDNQRERAADIKGVEYAITKGHDPKKVVNGLEAFYKHNEGNAASGKINGTERIALLRDHFKMEA